MPTFDFTVLNYIYGHFHSGALDMIMPLITALGNAGLIWIALSLILLISRQTRWVGIAILLALAIDVRRLQPHFKAFNRPHSPL